MRKIRYNGINLLISILMIGKCIFFWQMKMNGTFGMVSQLFIANRFREIINDDKSYTYKFILIQQCIIYLIVSLTPRLTLASFPLSNTMHRSVNDDPFYRSDIVIVLFLLFCYRSSRSCYRQKKQCSRQIWRLLGW